MKIYDGLEEFHPVENAVVTSGTFDGVHLGHQKIITRLNNAAKSINGESLIITFWPHPRLVLYPEQKDLKLLSTFEEKAALLEELGVQHLLKIHFTVQFSHLTSTEFIRKILIEKLCTKKLIIGYDHKFGRNREGSFEHLQKNSTDYGFDVEEIPAKDIDNVNVSSSKIRACLGEGDVFTASEYLGRPYSIRGKVISGDKIGRQIGFPTANISIPSPYKQIPEKGIYAVRTEVGGKLYNGMLYIGNRPTIDGTKLNIEVNIFEFDQDIYNELVTIYFYKQIRKDERFDSLDALAMKLQSDKIAAQQILKDI